MKAANYSIWKGKGGAITWMLALVMLISTELLCLYFQISVSHKWSSPIVLLAIMLTLPFSVGVNIYRKLVKDILRLQEDPLIRSCSFNLACVVLTANAVAFMIVVESFLTYYRACPK
jgi:hypothetical protein